MVPHLASSMLLVEMFIDFAAIKRNLTQWFTEIDAERKQLSYGIHVAIFIINRTSIPS